MHVCILLFIYLSDLEFAISPVTVILFPGDTSAVFACEVNPPYTIPSWDIDGKSYRLDKLFDGDLPGHNASRSNVTVSSPVNGTRCQCVISQLPPTPPILSDPPAFLYIAGKFFYSTLMNNPYRHYVITAIILPF